MGVQCEHRQRVQERAKEIIAGRFTGLSGRCIQFRIFDSADDTLQKEMNDI
ncbi:hypothetical protein [Methanofollis tationis]|uniref:hypothetical protein n=1 Tax=Methanofollis tationis TaxID=81417 RepID=UPI001C40B23D|nr:hypothetical protein [Methanofollis tationis]